ncbi:MAG: D-2-hydroxyacid dehydrogenase [Rhodospirillales bacterium]|nr:D-2-hydroxyacid dehydrogenase [Rhodospirillales bacterium]
MIQKPCIFITSPLEAEQANRIRETAGGSARLLFEPDLLPPIRYVADHKGQDDFRRTPEQETRWRDCLGQAHILWDFPAQNAEGTGGLALAPNVKWVQTTSSGVGQLVKNLGLQDSDVLVTTARGVHAGPLSEFVLLAILTHFKRAAHLAAEQRAHRWERYCGDDLFGRTLAMVGAGAVGGRVAEVCRFLGMRTIAMDTALTRDKALALGFAEFFEPADLHHMLGQTDMVAICLPQTPDTEQMIDAAAFAAMKPGTVFINIGRGSVVDEAALIAALQSGHLAFAGLDVFETEPLPPESPLWDMNNVLVSPHSTSTVASENAKITDIFCHNLGCYLSGRRADMWNLLDKARMY